MYLRISFSLALLLAGCGGTVIGTPGEPGQPGTPGKDAPAFVSLDPSRVYSTSGIAKLWSSATAGAACHPGDFVLTGGCSITGVGADAWLTENSPTFQGSNEGWACSGWATSKPSTVDTSPHILTVTITCYAAKGEP